MNATDVNDIALRLFYHQAEHNAVYKAYLQGLRIRPRQITEANQIPYLPISFFKTHLVKTGSWSHETLFTSSGTTGHTTSRHAVEDVQRYGRHCERIFERFYGPLANYHILALLPAYQERTGSSLIAMMDWFINRSGSPHSGYFLYDHDRLAAKLQQLRGDKRKTLLWGVTFALLDFADRFDMDLSDTLIIETGGMKGRRKEQIRQEVHAFLGARLNAKAVHSEYGMTELLSQAYSQGEGVFEAPPWLRVTLRDPDDPFLAVERGRAGIVKVMDLANAQTCCFIETQDLGRVAQNGNFEILGRVDNSDIRGCNLLVQ
jgi:phenylacetate-coenzyme A ligase PaaK-like adenylate-forming protein